MFSGGGGVAPKTDQMFSHKVAPKPSETFKGAFDKKPYKCIGSNCCVNRA